MEKQSQNLPPSEYLLKDIELSYKKISSLRDGGTPYLRIYLNVILGQFALIAFVEKLKSDHASSIASLKVEKGAQINIPSLELIPHAMFGLTLAIFIFILGWVILDYYTRVVEKTIIHYKQIGHLRHIIIKEYPIMRKYNVLPTKPRRVPLQITRHIPTIGTIVNFLTLILIYFYLDLLTLSKSNALLITMFVLTLVLLVYPIVLDKYFEKRTISQMISPGYRYSRSKEFIRDVITQNKEDRKYIQFKNLHFLFVIVTIILSMLYLALGTSMNGLIFCSILIPFLIAVVTRVYMSFSRLSFSKIQLKVLLKNRTQLVD